MELYIDYVEFGSDPIIMDFGNGAIDDKSFFIYSKDGDTKVFLGSCLYGNSIIDFSIDGDDLSYTMFAEYPGVILFAKNSDGKNVTIPYDVFVSADISLFFSRFDSKGELIVAEVDPEFVALIDNTSASIIHFMGDSIEDVSSNISDALSDFSDDFDDHFVHIDDSFEDIVDNFEDVTSLITSVKDSLSSVDIDLSPVTISLDAVNTRIKTLSSDISSVVSNVVDITSMNGANGTYKDGSTVTIAGLPSLFIVDASFLMKNDGNSYVTIYKLLDKSDHSIVLYSPSNFVVLAS